MSLAVVDCRVVAVGGLDERYVAGRLTGEEREAFELHYMGCAACFERLTWMEAARDRLCEPRDLHRRSGRGLSRRWWFMPAAAAAAVALAMVWLTRRDETSPVSPAPMVTSAPSPSSTPDAAPREPVARETDALAALARFEAPAYRASALRSSGDAAARQFREAMTLYERGQHRDAISQLSPVAPQRVDAAFFLAACHLLTGDAGAAVDAATRTLAFGDTPYVEETHLLIAKAWLTLGDRQRAAEALDAVIGMQGEFLTEARNLRDRLPALPRPQ